MQDLKYLIKKPSLVFDNLFNLRTKLAYGTALRETFIDQQYLWLLGQARKSTTAIDIGAFIGDTAIYLAQSSKIKHIYSFEPNPKSYAIAVENVKGSPFKDKITLSNAAIGASTGKGSSSGTGLGYTKFKEGGLGRGVQVKKLDAALANLKNVMIKCDVEGAEVDIFRDSNLKNVYAIQLEYHDTKEEMRKILLSKGFKISIQGDKKGVIYKNIGHICAYRK